MVRNKSNDVPRTLHIYIITFVNTITIKSQDKIDMKKKLTKYSIYTKYICVTETES